MQSGSSGSSSGGVSQTAGTILPLQYGLPIVPTAVCEIH